MTQGHLDSLKHISDLTFEAVLPSSVLEGMVGKGKKKHVIVKTSINIMGPESLADMAGTALEATSANLQHPVFLAAGIRYVNPHWFYIDGEPTDLRHLIGPPLVGSDSNRGISDVVEVALGSLDNPNHLQPRISYGSSNPTNTLKRLLTKLKPFVFKLIVSSGNLTNQRVGIKQMAYDSSSAEKMHHVDRISS